MKKIINLSLGFAVLLGGGVLVAGEASRSHALEIPAGHPANPAAPSSPLVSGEDPFRDTVRPQPRPAVQPVAMAMPATSVSPVAHEGHGTAEANSPRAATVPKAASPVADTSPVATAGSARDPLLSAYLNLTEALAADREVEASAALQKIREAAASLAGKDAKSKELAGRITAAIPAEAGSLEAIRKALRDLSAPMIDYARANPPPAGAAPRVYEAYCPMAKASWIQTGETIANPYYGAKMLSCGSITASIPETLKPSGDEAP